jgi:hypothetical protein
VAGLDHDLLMRYIEWLNGQCRADGRPWTKACRARTYTTLRTLLQWLERCRPGLIAGIEYPFNPFPWRNRDEQPRSAIPPEVLRAILKACEADIAEIAPSAKGPPRRGRRSKTRWAPWRGCCNTSSGTSAASSPAGMS